MLIGIISIIVIAIVLFVLSYFVNDRFEQLEGQVEQLSISMMQDTYQIKKKLKLLEEEVLPEEMMDDMLTKNNE
ncbi:hypothetical protein GCM10010978_19130 [Compostibacillus humi]|uniref:Uncharacterized protein n=1 Tax=Compostibacillus humi TaxID=1245525 RepID=A0A8J2TKS5_9BACI|nr:hypothetical protein [Compostibacillus humi]GFZ77732.1 hypothetical protein GCM10010978_19130 [Compostibacillus humi]HLT55890.1 hypothetical protein [Bacillota bacterium]